MSTNKNASTIEIVRKLVNRLPEEKNDELRLLIRRAEEGEDTTIEIIDLLSPNENIRSWMREQLNLQNTTRSSAGGYSPLPGRPRSISASKKWVCPERSCSESLPVIQVGEDAPICDLHGSTMIRGDKKRG
jgi:hypothetical protein